MKKNILFLILTLSGISALASDYEIDSSHSNVGFTIRHFVSKISGDFKDFKGTIGFDEKKPAGLIGELTIQAASVNTGNAKRDAHLRNEDFFDVSKNPTITFTSKSVKSSGKNKFKVTGDFNMHGVTKTITLDVEYLGKAKDFEGTYRAGFTLAGKIKRKEFNMTWNKVLDAGNAVLSDDVDLNIQIEAKELTAKK